MRRRGVVVLAAVAAAVAAAVTPASAAPTAPYTALTVVNEVASTPVGAPGGAVTVDGDALTVSRAGSRAVQAQGSAPDGGTATIAVSPPRDTEFAVGSFAVGGPGGFSPDQGALSLGGRAACSGTITGTVTVFDVTLVRSRLTSIGLDVAATCDGTPFAASLRIASPTPYAGVDLGPGSTDVDLLLGEYRDVPVTLTATGTETLPAVTEVALVGDDAALAGLRVVAQDCTGRVIGPDESCTVTVRVTGGAVGAIAAVLQLRRADTGIGYEVSLSATTTDTVRGTYYPATPRRVLDTRNGTGSDAGPIGPGQTLTLDTRDWTGRPASAVVVNLTVDRPTAEGYLTAYPGGAARPTASSINFVRGWTGANLVTVPVGPDGTISLFNFAGSTPTVVDLVGYYAGDDAAVADDTPRGGGYHPVLVQRIFDSRAPYFARPLPPGGAVVVPVAYSGDGGNIAALAVNVTAVNMRGAGYVTTWNGTGAAPITSTVNFTPSTAVVSNAAIVPAAYNGTCSGCASIALVNRSGATVDVVVDVTGYFDGGALGADVRFRSLDTPTRIVDTRRGVGTAKLGAGTTRTVSSPVGGPGTVALDLNVTAVKPTVRTVLTVWPARSDYPRPTTSLLNPRTNQVVAGHAIAEVANGSRFNVYNATGTVDLVVDVAGLFEQFPPPVPTDARAAPAAAPTLPGNRAAASPSALA